MTRPVPFQSVVQRLREKSFEPGVKQLPYVHVLDLAEDGYIKPHIDSVRVITGIKLF